MLRKSNRSLNSQDNKATTTNGLLKTIVIVTLLLSFTALIVGGYGIFKGQAPTPMEVVTPDREVIMTEDTIKGGQAVFLKYGLMDYGTVLGNGSYMGPDYTAEALKVYTEGMQDYYAELDYGTKYIDLDESEKSIINDRVINEMRENRFKKDENTLYVTGAQVFGVERVEAYYRDIFTNGDGWGLEAGLIQESHLPETDRTYVAEGDQLEQISHFFWWTAWLSSTERIGDEITYTNNWPYYEDAGNTMSYSAILWSAVSVTVLAIFIAVILYFFYRYHFGMQPAFTKGNYPEYDLKNKKITVSQAKSAKFFLLVVIMFFIQVMFGALLAHYYTEPDTFFGIDWIYDLLPFGVSKGFHLQLAIFWIATAWLGLGIYLAPNVGGIEPKRQGLLVDILFWALVIVVCGSMIGQWLGVNGYLGNLWFLLGHQGWEYLELGRLWQYALVAGLAIWLYILYRGIHNGLKKERDKGGLIHLLFYASIAVPAFYIFAFFINPEGSFTMSDFWRWWVVHLWVEGIFEVFAIVIIGYMLVSMKLVTKSSVVRMLYFQIILLLGTGVLGMGHHYYYNGSPEIWVAVGAVFSALEIIPLTLLILEAYEQYKMLKAGGVHFPYKMTFWFLIATSLWNIVGAGATGFLINLPAVNYFEHGQQLTPAHGHAAMMGVYGMFAIAVLLYSLRNVVKPEKWNDKWIKASFWLLNIGLFGMVFVALMPIGFIQLKEAFVNGYWSSRTSDFLQQDIIQNLLLVRAIPDTIFIVGVVILVVFCVKAVFNLKKPAYKGGDTIPEDE
ncbi:nitric-oxide reductase large subunit [Virgibacillus indicus]|uniref:Nitric-oxide reductase large subunit n=1 Tax=Virgibacillus indicus TaxID=2024554 RepID=A0A265NB57_9BACI|nr:cbb3-type cytochrome c oxidase subunit I [Virgibacillus indicus]OZU89051.1 nitric-oxide reductase large subunit [Virgibacillus indicus]